MTVKRRLIVATAWCCACAVPVLAQSPGAAPVAASPTVPVNRVRVDAPPPGVPRDPLLEQRRTSLPKTQPWPVEFFQPQETVRGEPRGVLRRAEGAELSIASEALDAARTWAQELGSSALLVWHDGAVQLEWYAPGTGPATPTHSYNLHWLPVVLLVGMAISDGHIRSIDDPVAKYVPEWRGTPKERITLRHLLQQNAGLELRFDASYSEGMYSRDARAYWGSNSVEVILREYPSRHPPGTVFDYNYVTPVILGAVLERTTARRYADLLSEKLWRPLGNHDARVWLNRPGGEAHLDAALFAGPRDWLHLGVLLVERGRFDGRQLVPAAWIDEIRRPSATNPNFGFTYLASPFQSQRRMTTDPRVGYRVHATEPFVAEDTYCADGYGGQRVYVVPSRRLVVVRLGTPVRGADWDDSRLVNVLARGIRAGGAR